MTPETAATNVQASENSGEIANWITLFYHKWHGVPWVDFLHRWENVFFAWLFGLAFLIFAVRVKKNIECLTFSQNLFELFAQKISDLFMNVLGEHGKKHIPFVGTLFIFILLDNWMGIVPGFKSPTSSLNTTIGLALVVFFYVQFVGLRENGLWGYIYHFMGSPKELVEWFLVPLNFPLHILQELIKPVSLSLRLFGNISGEDALLAAFVVLGIGLGSFLHLPVGVPIQLPFMLLSFLLGVVQALVFSFLVAIYITLMFSHEEEHS